MSTESPMLASPSTGAGGRQRIDVRRLVTSGDWVLDLKVDGIRAYARNGRLINRQGVDITAKFPEIVLPDHWVDGEVVALDNKFETVAQRDKLEQRARIARGAEINPCRLIGFDMPQFAAEAWSVRRQQLTDLFSPTTPVGYDTDFMDHAKTLGMEGVIAKRIESRYQFGRRSPDWVKHKFTHRISCLLSGYEPGNGGRSHLGALKLALIDAEGQVVKIGRCGSGFTDKQSHDLKVRLDRAEVLVAEIEALNLTSGGTLRFPVFRGLRSDVDPVDCTTAQLDQLPRSSKEL